jgi:hypothetical protein
MFRASSCPSSGATTTAVAASGLPSELGDCSAVGRGRAENQISRIFSSKRHPQNNENEIRKAVYLLCTTPSKI